MLKYRDKLLWLFRVFFSGIIFLLFTLSCLTNPQSFLWQKRSLGDLLRCFLTTEKGMAIYQLVLFYFFWGVFSPRHLDFLYLHVTLGWQTLYINLTQILWDLVIRSGGLKLWFKAIICSEFKTVVVRLQMNIYHCSGDVGRGAHLEQRSGFISDLMNLLN